MIFILLTTVLIADGGGAQTNEDSCNPHEVNVCVDATPRTQVGLPRSKEELDKHSLAYQTDQSTIKRCLPTDGQKLVQQQIGGARALMRYLCSNDTLLRRDFLKEPSCWALESPDCSRCVDELQLATQDISERSHHVVYLNQNTELCCARDAFVSCVSHAGRACSSAAGALLRRMAWMLSQDVAACSPADEQPRAPCASPRPPRLSALLSIMYYTTSSILHIYYI